MNLRLLVIASAALASTAFSPSASAEDCVAERYAAAQAIQAATNAIEIELGPYEAAVMAGDLEAFEAAAQWMLGPWEGLFAVIAHEQSRLRGVACPLDSIPDRTRLPTDWETVRDIGVWQVVDIDRNITVRNAASRSKHTAHAQP
jgi:hypothetical protein